MSNHISVQWFQVYYWAPWALWLWDKEYQTGILLKIFSQFVTKWVKRLSGHWDSLFTTSKSIKLSSLLFGRELRSLRTSSEGFSDLGPVVALTPLASATPNNWWNWEWPRDGGTRIRDVGTITAHTVRDWECLISQTRQSKVLETVDRSWSKFGSDDFPSAKDTQFGEDFQSSLMSKVEKHTALSKAFAITKRSKRERKHPPFLARCNGKEMSLFRGGPPAKYGGRLGKSFFLYNPHPYQKREGDFSWGRWFTNSHRQGQKPSLPRQISASTADW